MTTRAWPWWVCGVLLTATLLNYMDRQTLAVTLPTLKQLYALGEKRVGYLEGSFGFAFAFGSIIFGLLADRYGPRMLYPLVVAGWSLAGLATAFAANANLTTMLETPTDDSGAGVFRWLLLCRILLGIFEAGHWPCALLTVRSVLSANDRTLGNGVLQSGASLGAILIPQYIRACEAFEMPWTFPFWSVGLVGFAWVAVWFMFMHGVDLKPTAHEASGTSDETAVWRKLVVLGSIVATLTISWQFLRAWLPLYLQDNRGYERTTMFTITTAYFIAADIGCLAAGAIIKCMTARGRSVQFARIVVFAAFTLLTASAAIIPWLSVVEIPLLLIAGAGILGLHPIYYSLVQELPSRRMGMWSGTLAAMGWMISSAFQIYVGGRIQAEKSYAVGLVVVGLAPSLGLLALATLWPATPRRTTLART
jgi:MFS transporter, ACS family, hexuronate transporter